MQAWMVSVKFAFDKRAPRLTSGIDSDGLLKMFNMGSDLTKPFEYLMATGNLVSKSGEDGRSKLALWKACTILIEALALCRLKKDHSICAVVSFGRHKSGVLWTGAAKESE